MSVPRTRPMLIALAGTLSVLIVAGCGNARSTTTSSGDLSASLGERFVAVVKSIQPEVAQIRTSRGVASGVVFERAGAVVTNAHVVVGAGAIAVTFADGTQQAARLRGVYLPDDLAVVTVKPPRPLRAATFADSRRVQVGEIALAIGNPLGLQSSVTDGIVSAVGRSVVESGGIVLANAIQTSAPINPGNSGGALVNLEGQVIGLPTVVAVNPNLGTAAAGIGFAIPSNTVRDIAGQIAANGRVVRSHRAALGAHFTDSLDRPGAIVVSIDRAGAAEKAGIAVGDTIEALDGTSIAGAEALAAALAERSPGQTVTVRLSRPTGEHASVSVTLGELPGT